MESIEMFEQVISHPPDLLAGFIAVRPSEEVPELLMAGQQWGARGQRIGGHAHEVWEFYFQARGVSHWKVNRKMVTLEAGGFLAVPPGIHHEMAKPQDEEHEYYFAAVDPADSLRRLGLEAKSLPARRFVVISDAHEAGAAFRGLIREVSLVRPFRDAGLRQAVDALVLEAVRRISKEVDIRILAGLHPAVDRAARLMEQDLAKPWRVEALARLVGTSAGHLGVLFRRDLGTSPMDHLLALRMERARQLLLQPRLPITRIALDLGFSSSQHFANLFRQRNHCSPREFRLMRSVR